MASGFPGREWYRTLGASAALGGGHTIYQQRGDTGNGLLKRSLTEMERQQLQHALFLRSVRQKTLQTSPMSPLSLIDLSSISPEFTSSSNSSSVSSASLLPPNVTFVPRQQNYRFSDLSFITAPPVTKPETERNSSMQNRLQELERQLLDDDDAEDEVSVVSVSSAATNSEWSEAIQHLISDPAPTIVQIQNPVSPSPTTSSSSSSSSAASCSPTSTTASSRQLIADTATALAEGNIALVRANIEVLKRSLNPRGDCDQRFTTYMVGALLSRMNPPPRGAHPAPELFSREHLAAMQLLHDISPVFKHALLAANYAILEATKDHPKIHVIDFDVRHGGQYAYLIRALAQQHGHSHPPALKITAVCDPTLPFNSFNSGGVDLREVNEKLARMAERKGVELRFNIVRRRAAELDQVALGCEPGEALAVNFAFLLSRVADESVSPANPRDDLLRRVRALGPAVVTLVEQDLNTNTAPFIARAVEVCAHYGALFESLDAVAPRDSRERVAVEACLGRRAANAVAREGAERIERCEVLGKWRARMGMAGFKPSPLGPGVADPVRDCLKSLRSKSWFTLKLETGGLALGWKERVLTVASAWSLA